MSENLSSNHATSELPVAALSVIGLLLILTASAHFGLGSYGKQLKKTPIVGAVNASAPIAARAEGIAPTLKILEVSPSGNTMLVPPGATLNDIFLSKNQEGESTSGNQAVSSYLEQIGKEDKKKKASSRTSKSPKINPNRWYSFQIDAISNNGAFINGKYLSVGDSLASFDGSLSITVVDIGESHVQVRSGGQLHTYRIR